MRLREVIDLLRQHGRNVAMARAMFPGATVDVRTGQHSSSIVAFKPGEGMVGHAVNANGPELFPRETRTISLGS